MVAAKKKPWCAGIGSGDATAGRSPTGWKDFMLRLVRAGRVRQVGQPHDPVQRPRVDGGPGRGRRLPEEPAVRKRGLGDVKSIATTAFQDGGLPILEGNCEMHRQASFYAANLAEGHQGGRRRRRLRVLPARQGRRQQAGARRRRVRRGLRRPSRGKAFQTYLSTDTWANTKAKLSSGWVSANKGLDPNNLSSPIDKLAAQILLDPRRCSGFDGSDQMPAAVGSDAFWKQATSWITGQDTKTTVDNIEKGGSCGGEHATSPPVVERGRRWGRPGVVLVLPAGPMDLLRSLGPSLFRCCPPWSWCPGR